MVNQTVWVHGTSGQIEVWKKNWGWTSPIGWGLHMDVKVQNDSPKDQPWVHFHIPVIREDEDKRQLETVMLRFSTDCDKANPDPPYKLGSYGYEKWPTDAGGAIVRQIHVYDGEDLVEPFDDLDWQTDDLGTYDAKAVDLTHKPWIRWGLGVSVHIWFKNQFFIDKRLQPDLQNTGYFPVDPDWDGKPWLNPATATKSKRAVIVSVGCLFAPVP